MPVEKIGPFNDAAEFLTKLEAEHTHPQGAFHQFGPIAHVIFRGQCDPSWGLLPVVFRKGFRWEPYLGWNFWNDAAAPAASSGERVSKVWAAWHAEHSAVLEFLKHADFLGLLPPLDYVAFDESLHEVLRRFYEANLAKEGAITDALVRMSSPNPRLYDWYALAQHSGVPTRLLDWSESPLVAAFFAAYGAWEYKTAYETLEPPTPAEPRRREGMSDIAVFVAKTVHMEPSLRRGDHYKFTVHAFRTSRAANTNIRAQQGVFTNMISANAYMVDNGKWPALDEVYPEQIKKFVLARGEVNRLLELLAARGVAPHTMLPSLENAARHRFYRHLLAPWHQ